MTQSQLASQPRSTQGRKRRDRAVDHSPHLQRKFSRLRTHLRAASLQPGESPTLHETTIILWAICSTLLDLTELMETYQLLEAAGEPVAEYVEQSLAVIARDLQEKTPEGQSSASS